MTQLETDVEGRKWPPVYDEASLDQTLRLARLALPKQFYLSSIDDPEPCQGDIIELASSVPVIDSDGEASGIGDATYWLVVANSCDVARMSDTDKVEYAPIAPLVPLASLAMDREAEQSARDYKLSRIFYLPEWDDDVVSHVADFTRLVPIHRAALHDHAIIRARMCRAAWVVLNACLVRLLCRADGRNE